MGQLPGPAREAGALCTWGRDPLEKWLGCFPSLNAGDTSAGPHPPRWCSKRALTAPFPAATLPGLSYQFSGIFCSHNTPQMTNDFKSENSTGKAHSPVTFITTVCDPWSRGSSGQSVFPRSLFYRWGNWDLDKLVDPARKSRGGGKGGISVSLIPNPCRSRLQRGERSFKISI